MTTKHYIVLVKEGVDLNQFWNEMETSVSTSPYIPKRPVAIINSRELFPRLCEYELTDAEAIELRNDPRVAEVDIPIEQNPDVTVIFGTVQAGNFSRNIDSDLSNHINWGLVRHSNIDSKNNSKVAYQYTLDGTNVDVVISDSGIQADHPEFTDADGVSRVKQIDWGSIYAPLSGKGGYNDNNGHGTNVAGIAVGKTYGWAKNANIYSIYSPGNNDQGNLDHFNGLLAWQLSKPINPVTGRKNPTVINMSWGYGRYNPSEVSSIISRIDKVVYRGTTYPPGNLINWGIRNDSAGQYLQLENQAIDYVLGVLVNAGAVVCRSAMNNRYKIDVPGGADYDNYFTVKDSATRYYYHRGFTPKSPNSISVGSIDSWLNADGREQKSGFSCAGPGVDVFAAGSNIVSAGTSRKTSLPAYPNSPSFKVSKYSGTSQASPNVAGMCALYLQANPTATPAQVKEWLTSSANTNALYKAGTDDYGNDSSIFGSSGGTAYLKMSENVISNKYKSYTKDQSGTWKPVTGKFVKQSANTWAEIQSSYIKTANGWKQTYKKGS